MATHAGVALELGITRPGAGAGGLKMMSPQMEAILIWCQCRTRNYKVNNSHNIENVWHNLSKNYILLTTFRRLMHYQVKSKNLTVYVEVLYFFK